MVHYKLDDYPPGPVLSEETREKRMKFLASAKAKPIRAIIIEKHLSTDVAPSGLDKLKAINSLVLEDGWAWEEVRGEGFRWNDNPRRSHLTRDWDDIVQLALAWSACN